MGLYSQSLDHRSVYTGPMGLVPIGKHWNALETIQKVVKTIQNGSFHGPWPGGVNLSLIEACKPYLLGFPSLIPLVHMAVYRYSGYETGQGWTLEPGNPEAGIQGGPISQYWGRSLQYSLISPPNPPSRFPGFVSTPGMFHTLDIYTLPKNNVRSYE